MSHWKPAEPVYFPKRTAAAVLFMSGCFLGLGLILYFYG